MLLYLAEDDIASAWALAEDKPLTLATWRHFAPRIEDTRPESALRAYRAMTEAAAAQTSKQGYAEACDWLRRMQPLHERLGSLDDFARYLVRLRATHRAKRSFMALLDDAFGRLGN